MYPYIRFTGNKIKPIRVLLVGYCGWLASYTENTRLEWIVDEHNGTEPEPIPELNYAGSKLSNNSFSGDPRGSLHYFNFFYKGSS